MGKKEEGEESKKRKGKRKEGNKIKERTDKETKRIKQ